MRLGHGCPQGTPSRARSLGWFLAGVIPALAHPFGHTTLAGPACSLLEGVERRANPSFVNRAHTPDVTGAMPLHTGDRGWGKVASSNENRTGTSHSAPVCLPRVENTRSGKLGTYSSRVVHGLN